MTLRLRHITGFNGALRGGIKAHPTSPGHLFYVTGGQIVTAHEDVFTPQGLLKGHDGFITAMALSHTGALLATGQGGTNSDVVLWDTASHNIRTRFQEHDIEVLQLTFSLDDRLLLTVGHEKDHKLFVLDIATGKIVAKTQMEYNRRVTAAAFGPMQNNIYTFATAVDSEITMWTLDPYMGTLSNIKVTPGSVRRVYTCMLFSADGQWLFAGTTSGDVVAVNVMRRAVQLVHPACAVGVGAMMLSSSRQLLVAGGDGTITQLTNDLMWREIKPFASVPGSVTSMSASADGSALILGTSQGAIFRVTVGSMAVHSLAQSHTHGIRGIAFMPGGADCVATCSDDASVAVWSLQDYSQVHRVAEASAGPALSVVLTPDLIVSGWADGNIRCHLRNQGHTAPQAWLIPGAHSLAHSVGVTALKVANRGHFVASGGAGGEVRVWDLRSRELVSHLKMHTAPVTDVSVLADDCHLAVSSEDRSWSLLDLHQEKCRAQWRTNTMIKGHAMAPDQVSVVTIGLDARIQLFDIRAPEPVRAIAAAHAGEISAVAMHLRGASFATGGADGMVKVWDLRSLSVVTQVAAHIGPVTKLAFSPSEVQLASVGLDGAVMLWDM